MRCFFAPFFFIWFITSALSQGWLPLASSGTASISTNSLLLISASSQYLSQTGRISINQQKFTIATWVKTTGAGLRVIYHPNQGGGTGGQNDVLAQVETDGTVTLAGTTANVSSFNLRTTGAVNDGNWHSLVLAVDTTQAVGANRSLIYIDGVVAALSQNTPPAQNANLANNFAATYYIGAAKLTASVVRFFNGNLAQVYYIDGQQLTPSSFITGTPGVPKTYSGTYTGTFDFFLPFSNGGALGTDSSGEGNNWTPNNGPTQSTDHP